MSQTEPTRNLGPTPDGATFMTAAEGAAPAPLAATGIDVEGGQYLGPDGPGERSGSPGPAVADDNARDPAVAVRLRDWAEGATGPRYPAPSVDTPRAAD